MANPDIIVDDYRPLGNSFRAFFVNQGLERISGRTFIGMFSTSKNMYISSNRYEISYNNVFMT